MSSLIVHRRNYKGVIIYMTKSNYLGRFRRESHSAWKKEEESIRLLFLFFNDEIFMTGPFHVFLEALSERQISNSYKTPHVDQ
jgi:hypothetical protein